MSITIPRGIAGPWKVTLGSPYAEKKAGEAVEAQTSIANQLKPLVGQATWAADEARSLYGKPGPWGPQLLAKQHQLVSQGRQRYGSMWNDLAKRGIVNSTVASSAMAGAEARTNSELAALWAYYQQLDDERKRQLLAQIQGAGQWGTLAALGAYGQSGSLWQQRADAAMEPVYQGVQMVGQGLGQVKGEVTAATGALVPGGGRSVAPGMSSGFIPGRGYEVDPRYYQPPAFNGSPSMYGGYGNQRY